jgi:hypothetical protein
MAVLAAIFAGTLLLEISRISCSGSLGVGFLQERPGGSAVAGRGLRQALGVDALNRARISRPLVAASMLAITAHASASPGSASNVALGKPVTWLKAVKG